MKARKKRPCRRSDSNVRSSVAALIGTFQHIADWLTRQSKMGLNCVITHIYGSLVSILTILREPSFKCGRYGIVKMLTNDPEIYVITQFNPFFDWRFNQLAICQKVPIIAATDLRTFESDRRQGLFFLLSLSLITIHDCTHVCSTYSSLYTCFIRKKGTHIKSEIKKCSSARVRTFILPHRSPEC